MFFYHFHYFMNDYFIYTYTKSGTQVDEPSYSEEHYLNHQSCHLNSCSMMVSGSMVVWVMFCWLPLQSFKASAAFSNTCNLDGFRS